MAGAEQVFELSVLISAIDKFTGPMKGIGKSITESEKQISSITKSMKNLGQSAADIERVQEALKKLETMKQFKSMASDLEKIGMSKTEIQAIGDSFEKMAAQQDKIEKIGKVMDKFKTTTLVGAGMTAAGVGMAAGLMHAADEAGKLLTVMTTIQDATGASSKDLQSIQNTIRSTSAVTKYGIMDTANFASTLATSGYNAPQVNALLPTFTKFAEVQEYGKGMDPQESIKQAIELAHGFGKYSPKELDSFLNMYNKGTFLQPEGSDVYGETLKYTMTQAKTLGLSDQDTMFMAALSNRMGLAGSMGGTNAADMLMRSIPGLTGGMAPKIDKTTGAVTYPKALQAMMNIGIADSKGNSSLFQNGKIVDLQKFIDQLYTHTKNLTPEKRMQTYHDIFGIQGGRAAALFGSQRGQEQLAALHQGMSHISGINNMQEDYLKTPEGQINQLKSNLQNLKFNVFLVMAKDLNPFIQNLNKAVVGITNFSNKHPQIAKYIATFAMMGTGIMLIAGPLTSTIGLLGMMGTGMGKLGRAKALVSLLKDFKGLSGAAKFLIKDFGVVGGTFKILTRSLGIFGKFIGRITGLTKVWTVVTGIFNAVMDANPIALIILAIIALIVTVVLLITHWKQVTKVAIEVWNAIKQFGAWIGKMFVNMWKDAVNWGANIIKGLWNGIKNFGGWLGSKIKSFVSDHITGPFKHFLGIHSPSTVFMEHGKYIVQGLANGITGNASLATKATTGLAQAVNRRGSQLARSAMMSGGGGGDTIIINPHKNQRAEEIADHVMKKMGKSRRRKAMTVGSRLVPTAR